MPPPNGIAATREELHHSSACFELALIARAHDEVGRMLEAPAKAAHDVHVGLAQSVRGARVGVRSTEGRQLRGNLDPRRRERELLERERLLDLAELVAEVAAQTGRR